MPGDCFRWCRGKTTAMFTLARHAAGRIIITTATHLAVDQLSLADAHFIARSPAEIDKDCKSICRDTQSKVFLITGPLITVNSTMDQLKTNRCSTDHSLTHSLLAENRISGLNDASIDHLHSLCQKQNYPLLIESDGSRCKPLKAPGAHEPAVPAWVDTVVVVAGMSGLGKPLGTEWVHRPQIFALLCGLNEGALVTPAALARVLTHPAGG